MLCQNCSAELDETHAYCPACGQEVAEGRDRSVMHLLRSGFVELTSVDSRLWRSLGTLFFRPGTLSSAYRTGRRRYYLSPIGLFLLGNLLYFLAPPLSDLQLSLTEQYELQPYRALVIEWVDCYLAKGDLSFADIERHYELKVAELAKLMVILHVPLMAMFTQLLFIDRRLYYADHVVVALHYFAFIMIYLIAMSSIFSLIFWLLPDDWKTRIPNLSPVILAVLFVYATPMLKRGMGVSWWRAIVTTPLFIIAFFFAHFAYRLLQFVIGFSLVTIA
ncbi:MAG: DUF3667 domain-containing protein [Pseudomonadota bacterium]